MKGLVAVALTLLLAGCTCPCGDKRLDEHARRPGDVVRALRDAVGDRQWEAAAQCFAPEVRREHAARMKAGEFDWPLGPRDVLVSMDVQDELAVAKIDPVPASEGRPREVRLNKNCQGHWQIISWR